MATDTLVARETLLPTATLGEPRRLPTRAEARQAESRRATAAALAFVIPVLTAVAATFTWFRPGRFIAAGDVSPFVRDGLAGEFGWLWNHRVSGAGATSAEIARALEVVMVRTVGVVGGSDAAAQHLLYAFVAGLAAFGAAYFARAFTASPTAVAVAGLVGVFNPVVLVNLPNPLPLLAIGLLGTLGGLVLRAAQDRPVSGLRFAAVTVLASYLSVNPPLLVVTVLGVAAVAAGASLLAGAGGSRRAARLLVRAAPWALLLNAWWLVPFALANLRSEGIEFVATTDAAAWAWSHVENSVVNVVTLNASWAWPHSEYLPFAPRLDGAPWVWLRWVLPLTAFAAPFLVQGRRRSGALALAGAGAVLVIVAKGFHAPFSGVNQFLYDHVPGFWLLREPMSKVGGLLVLVYAALAAITVGALTGRRRRRPVAEQRRAIAGAVIGAIAMLAYAFPLWTGSAIRGGSDDLPGMRSSIPTEWREAAAYVNESAVAGKALVLPLASFYQMTTRWGYHGVDDVARQLLRRPVLQVSPGGYFRDTGSVESIVTRVEDALVAGDTVSVPRLLQALGVSHVLIRHDFEQGQVVRPVADDDALAEALDELPGTRGPVRFGVVDVYELAEPGGAVQAYSTAVGTGDSTRTTASLVAELGAETAAVPLDASGLGAVSVTVGDGPLRTDVDLARGGRYAVDFEGGDGDGLYRAQLEDDRGSGTTLTLTDPTQGTLDGHQLPVDPTIRVPLGTDDIVGLAVGTELRTRDGDDSPVVVGPATPVIGYREAGPSVLGPFSEVSDCHKYDELTPREAGLAAEPVADGVRLRAESHSACVFTPVAPATATVYRLQLSTRAIAGQRPRVCVWQEGPQRCATLPDPPTAPGWADADVLVAIEPGTIGVQVFLYADGDGGGETIADYRGVSLVPLAEAAGAVIDPLPAPSLELDLPAGEHRLEVLRDLPAPVLGSFSALRDCNAVDDRRPEEVGLEATLIDGGIRLVADEHSACVTAKVNDAGMSAYRLTLDARTEEGRPARVCVWQVGPNRCADLPELETQRDWSGYSATFAPEPGTMGLELYLYADGQDGPRTVTEYRDLRLRPVVPTTLRIEPAAGDDESISAPSIEWHADHPGRYTVRVRDAEGPFVLALAESFGDGWELHGLPAGAGADHIVVDGYANGWRIDATGDFELVIEHRPTAWARAALRVSVVTAVAAIAVAAARWLRRRGRLRARWSRGPLVS